MHGLSAEGSDIEGRVLVLKHEPTLENSFVKIDNFSEVGAKRDLDLKKEMDVTIGIEKFVQKKRMRRRVKKSFVKSGETEVDEKVEDAAADYNDFMDDLNVIQSEKEASLKVTRSSRAQRRALIHSEKRTVRKDQESEKYEKPEIDQESEENCFLDKLFEEKVTPEPVSDVLERVSTDELLFHTISDSNPQNFESSQNSPHQSKTSSDLPPTPTPSSPPIHEPILGKDFILGSDKSILRPGDKVFATYYKNKSTKPKEYLADLVKITHKGKRCVIFYVENELKITQKVSSLRSFSESEFLEMKKLETTEKTDEKIATDPPVPKKLTVAEEFELMQELARQQGEALSGVVRKKVRGKRSKKRQRSKPAQLEKMELERLDKENIEQLKLEEEMVFDEENASEGDFFSQAAEEIENDEKIEEPIEEQTEEQIEDQFDEQDEQQSEEEIMELKKLYNSAKFEKLQQQRLDLERLEKARLEEEERLRLAEWSAKSLEIEKERLLQEKLEKERVEKEKSEKERVEREKADRIKRRELKRKQLQDERLNQALKARKETEKREESEKLAKLEKERLEQEKLEKEYSKIYAKLEKERLKREKLEQKRVEEEERVDRKWQAEENLRQKRLESQSCQHFQEEQAEKNKEDLYSSHFSDISDADDPVEDPEVTENSENRENQENIRVKRKIIKKKKKVPKNKTDKKTSSSQSDKVHEIEETSEKKLEKTVLSLEDKLTKLQENLTAVLKSKNEMGNVKRRSILKRKRKDSDFMKKGMKKLNLDDDEVIGKVKPEKFLKLKL